MKGAGLFLGIALLFAASVSHAQADNDDLSIRDVLVTAKWTGACGALNSMQQFQDQTQLDGGDEFLARYFKAEAARLDMNADEYAELCKGSIARYNAMWAVGGE